MYFGQNLSESNKQASVQFFCPQIQNECLADIFQFLQISVNSTSLAFTPNFFVYNSEMCHPRCVYK